MGPGPRGIPYEQLSLFVWGGHDLVQSYQYIQKGIGLPSRHSVPEKRRMARQHKASTLCEREKHPIRALEVSPGDICEHRLRYWFWQRRLCTTSDEVRSSRFVWTVSTQQRFTSEVNEDFFWLEPIINDIFIIIKIVNYGLGISRDEKYHPVSCMFLSHTKMKGA